MPWRTPLVCAFAAGQGQSTTVRWAPLLSLAVPCSVPQACPKRGPAPLRDSGLRFHLVADAFAPPLALADELPTSTGASVLVRAILGTWPLA
jgi:hypothetical protein